MSERVHVCSFNLWNAQTRAYECECGARLHEEVLEAHAPYGSEVYRQRIQALKEMLAELWGLLDPGRVPTDLAERVLAEVVGVVPEALRQEALEALRRRKRAE